MIGGSGWSPTLGVSNSSFSELGRRTSPNVLQGTTRTRSFWALQEAFFEYKLADLGPDYDFVSVWAGTQPFNADFRGFLFSDVNRAVRIFGTQFSNRDQFNLAYFRQWEKDTNTALNTFNDRRQNLIFANYYRQDFLVPGYTAQVSLNYDNDPASLKFDKNRFLVRPDPDGNFQPHTVNVGYFGCGGHGHWGRYNLTHQFYWAFGHDSMNPLANRPQTINAQMAAIEGSYDRDWVGFVSRSSMPRAMAASTARRRRVLTRSSTNRTSRQPVQLLEPAANPAAGRQPDATTEAWSQIFDPARSRGRQTSSILACLLPTFGMDFDVTPKLKIINNYNLIWFDKTSVLQQFLFQGNINSFVGFDVGLGCEYRPLLSENVIFVGGVQMLIPGQGFRDIYDSFNCGRVNGLVAGFINAIFEGIGREPAIEDQLDGLAAEQAACPCVPPVVR